MKRSTGDQSPPTSQGRRAGAEAAAVRESPMNKPEAIGVRGMSRSASGTSSTQLRAQQVPPEAHLRAPAIPAESVDRFKVEQLRAALKSGMLKFDSTIVAERMIDQDG
jgi:anti-sigma28 factor (negative regulator of flagellin synthesis)